MEAIAFAERNEQSFLYAQYRNRTHTCYRILSNSGYFTVCDIASIARSRLSVTVCNCAGQLVLEENMNRENLVIRFTNTFGNGLYAVKITNEAGNTWQQKLVVNF